MKGLIIKITLAFIVLVIVGGGIGILAFTYVNLDLPKIEKLQDYRPNLASQIFSKDGVLLAEIGKEKREIVEIKDVPNRVVNAFLSAEDDKFFEHKGVDYFGLVRAMVVNFKAGKVVQGGSTITQQVAKSLLLTSERSITRKVKDFILAQKIEEKLSKHEILYLYLNQVYLGNGYYGVKAAARGYFNKELKSMTVAEAAMLAGLLVAPGKYSPYVNPTPAKKRQHYVLERMLKLNKISRAEYEEAIKENTIYYLHDEEIKAGYFTEWVRQKVVETVGENEFLVNGFKVKTTLDWNLQKIAEEQVLKSVRDVDKRQGFKGPIAHVDDISKFDEESLKKIMKKKSRFFVIEENGKGYDKKFEYNYTEKDYLKRKEEEKELKKSIGDDSAIIGLSELDQVSKALIPGELYEAAITKVDDNLKLIFVSLGGSPAVIPYDYFKWAHKRSVNENTSNYQEVKMPSLILKTGDVVYVQLVKSSASLGPYLTKDATAKLNGPKNTSFIKSQKYIICQLDQLPEVQGALFSIDARSGEVISYVGGNDFKNNKFNRVIQAKRQPGSSFKPILYAAALEHGYNPTTIIMDTPEAMPGFDSASSWKPKNYEGDYKGPVTMREALEESRNIPTIKIADKVGVATILKFVERIGFKAKLEANLSIALGTFGVNMRDLVTTYALFPNGGKMLSSKAILSVTDREGKKYNIKETDNDVASSDEKSDKQIDDPSVKNQLSNNPYIRNLAGNQVYDPRLAYVMVNLMKGVITSGTAQSARDLSPNIAGKTGTTSDYIDAWFIGYTSNVVTGVWAGFDDNKTLGHGETGAKAVLPAWKEFMRANIKKYGDQPFEMPPGVTTQWIVKSTGKKALPNSPGAIVEYFADDSFLKVDTSPSSIGGNVMPPIISRPEVPVNTKPKNSGDDEYYDNQ